MQLDDFQDEICATSPGADPVVTLLGLGFHAGALLETHRRYLREDTDNEATSALIGRHLSEVFGHIALFASNHGIRLDEIARWNVDKIAARALDRDLSIPEPLYGPVYLSAYSYRASITDEYAQGGSDPYALSVPIMGLAGEVGTLLVAQKKHYRDQDAQATDVDFLLEELGDVLWYGVAVAKHAKLDLGEVLDRSQVFFRSRAETARLLLDLPTDLPVLDRGYLPIEQIPRRLVFRFREDNGGTSPVVAVTLAAADPNQFPSGPIEHLYKPHGFRVGQEFGAALTDNSRRRDDYRYHDAIHLGFLAVMGWSPVIRGLLQLKRRSDGATDENEDGARATFAEEGLAAILAKRAPRFQNFETTSAVDDDSVELMTTVLEDLEVAQMPEWLWRRAIAEGFRSMHQLAAAGGGFLLVDLDSRSVSYSRTPPQL